MTSNRRNDKRAYNKNMLRIYVISTFDNPNIYQLMFKGIAGFVFVNAMDDKSAIDVMKWHQGHMLRDEITYSLPNFNGAAGNVVTYPCWD